MLISVIMSVYNAEEYLREAVESVLNQTFKDFEFIIIDDGSTDSSLSILNEYVLQDSRILLIQNSQNLGLPTSLNKGIEIAKGKYIARQDADDISIETRFEKQINYAQQNPEIDIIGCNVYIIDINGDLVCLKNNLSKIKNPITALLDRTAALIHGSVLLKKSKVIEVGSYDTRFYYSQDGELWLRLLTNNARMHVIDDPLYKFRRLPVKTKKKYNAQAAFHTVKKMIYQEGKNGEEVDRKLNEIQYSIKNTQSPPVLPNFMATYWKNLANTSYFNHSLSRFTAYKYLYRAYEEKIGSGLFFKLGVLYAMPKSLINAVIKK